MSNASKISSPEVDGAFVPQGVNAVLSRAPYGKGIWISAHAGSGKSSAVAACLKQLEIPHIWYRLDPSDEVPANYFQFLTQALIRLEYLPSSDLSEWAYDGREPLPLFARKFFRRFYTMLPSRCVLVMDDCGTVGQDNPFWEIIRIALEECPDENSILMLSRKAPPELFSKEIAYGSMELLESSVFRLSKDESIALIKSLYPALSAKELGRVVAQSFGWPMGLSLLGKQASDPETTGNGHLLCTYLSNEVMSEFLARDKNILFQISCLPVVSKADAVLVTNDPLAFECLDAISKQCFLVGKTDIGYRLAPLFREYLLEKAARNLPPEQVAELFKFAVGKAADLDEEMLLFRLLVGASLWPVCEEFLSLRADKLFAEGKSDVLFQWISGIPVDVRVKSPWMSYIEGRYLAIQSNPSLAHEYFARAMTLFRQINDVNGQALAWAGAVDTLYKTMRDYAAMDPWISEAERLFPSGELPLNDAGRMVAHYGLVPLFFRAPLHPFVSLWARRLENCIHRIKNRSQQIMLAIPLIRYYSWNGSGACSRTLIESLQKPDETASVLERALWHNLQSMCCMFGGDPVLSLANADEALRLLPPQAGPVAKYRIMLCGGYAALENDDCRRASEFVEAMKAITDEVTPFDEMQYHFIAGWVDLLLERYVASRAHFEESMAIARDCNIRWGASFAQASIVHVLLALGDTEAAESHLSQVKSMIGQTASRTLDYFISITQAWYEIETGKESDGLKHLEIALTVAQRENYTSNPWLTRAFLLKISLHALERQIEVPFVRRIIRELGLVPTIPPLHVDEWPWPVRIHTLGRFSILTDDQPVLMTAKGHGKPLELLKLLIAHGGREVPKDKLIETLWPELDGDFGQKAFDTALYRLRKLVGSDRVIQIHGRMVSIDHHSVWVDIWGLHRMVNKCRQTATEMDDHHVCSALTNKMIELYHADFLGEDSTYPIFEKKRKQLRKLFLECVIETASQFVYSGNEKEAVRIYLQVMGMLHDVPEIQTRYDALTRKSRVAE